MLLRRLPCAVLGFIACDMGQFQTNLGQEPSPSPALVGVALERKRRAVYRLWLQQSLCVCSVDPVMRILPTDQSVMPPGWHLMNDRPRLCTCN